MKKKKHYLIVVNWKMYLSFYESVSFCSINQATLQQIAKKQQLVILPSFVAINAVAQVVKETKILWGAQDCSQYKDGAYTGEISATMLQELGCTYCLVGHSERRKYFGETDAKLVEKYKRLHEAGIQPILCIGEEKKEKKIDTVKKIIKNQLSFLSKIKKQKKLCIAYEPAWAITKGGKKNQADYLHVNEVTEYIHTITSELCPGIPIQLLYGGSVDEKNIIHYAKISYITGFLIGSSGTHIETLASISAALSD